jgi:hypothetical protein
MSHNFIPSIKKNVNYCTHCGCLSYKNIPSKTIISHDNINNVINIDPLIIKYKPISLNLDLSLISHKFYSEFRSKGLSKIYFLSNKFNIDKSTIYKAIGLMDQIYLSDKNVSIEYIEIVSSICFLLSIQFNECFTKTNKIELNRINNKNYIYENNSFYFLNNLKCLQKYLLKEIKDIMYWQTFCLQILDYNLAKYSAFDYVNLFFSLGIIFSYENFDINNIYHYCLNIIAIIINNTNICKYNQYVIALSVIFLQIKNSKFFNLKIFKYIYGVDFSKPKYKSCINEINKMINDFYSLPNYGIININKDINFFYLMNSNVADINDINNYNTNNKNIDVNNTSYNKFLWKFIYVIDKLKIYNYINISDYLKKLNYYYYILSSLNFSNEKILFQIIQNIMKINLPTQISEKILE